MQNETVNGFDELESLFGGDSSELEGKEKIVLSQDLEGFAGCFPDWDIHPPVMKR